MQLEKPSEKTHILQKQQFIGLLFGMVVGFTFAYFAWGVDRSVPVASRYALPRTALFLGLVNYWIAGCVAWWLIIRSNNRLLALDFRTLQPLCISHRITRIPLTESLDLVNMQGKSTYILIIAPARVLIQIFSPGRRWC